MFSLDLFINLAARAYASLLRIWPLFHNLSKASCAFFLASLVALSAGVGPYRPGALGPPHASPKLPVLAWAEPHWVAAVAAPRPHVDRPLPNF